MVDGYYYYEFSSLDRKFEFNFDNIGGKKYCLYVIGDIGRNVEINGICNIVDGC